MYCVGLLAVLLVIVAISWWSVSSGLKDQKAALAARTALRQSLEKALADLPDFARPCVRSTTEDSNRGSPYDKDRRRVCLFTKKGAVREIRRSGSV